MLRFFSALPFALFVLCASSPAFADKVAVLPFTAPKGLSKPELDQARTWTREAALARGHVPPSNVEMIEAERAVKDGMPDTSSEYLAAGRASGSMWTITGRIERHDAPPSRLPGGTEEEGYIIYRLELEVGQIETGRVESLAREIDPDEAPAQIAEMLTLLLRPEGIKKDPLPWENAPPHKRKPKPKALPAAPPALLSAPPPTPSSPVEPLVRHAYAENRPVALGVSAGFSNALSRPSEARGPSNAMAIGAVFAYAFEQVPGVELRGSFTTQVIGPKALEISAGGRYAIPIVSHYRIFVGPELRLGGHVAMGAEKTARFLGHGSAFAAWGITEALQLEIAGDLSAAFGGSGTLVLAGGTLRGLFRF